MKKIKLRLFNVMVGFILLFAVLSACRASPAPVPTQTASAQTVSLPDELDAAIRETSDYLNRQLPRGNKLVILNIQSGFPALSEYIIDELIANTVNDRVFSVVDRQQLNTIRAELDFQMSGEVDDDTAQALGRMAGAQIIISGAVSRIGDLYRLRVRALSVQSAHIEGQFNRNIPDGPTVSALVRSQATGYGSGIAQPGTAPARGTAAAPAASVQAPVQVVPAQVPVPDPVPTSAPVPAVTVYRIGDTGPAGGLIFYDKGNNTGGWRYLEAAPADIDRTLFAARETFVPRTERVVGAGKPNTQAIMAEANNRGGGFGWAAQACDALVVNGFDDWFLPSRDELNFMYGNLHLRGLGNFRSARYWSSTFSRSDTWSGRWFWMTVNFSNGEHIEGLTGGDQFRVRACRQF